MVAEPGEQGQLLAAHEHVDRVDLDQTDPVEHLAEVASIDVGPVGRWTAQALGGERDAASERRTAMRYRQPRGSERRARRLSRRR